MKKFLLTLTILTFVATNQGDACTSLIVTPGASKTGSVMVTYSADSHTLYGELYSHMATKYPKGEHLKIYEWDTGKYLGQIDQVEQTYSTVGNMNEYQLIIAESTFGGRGELVDTTGIIDYGSLIYITLQRAKTAREAIAIMADLVDKYGYYSSGESISIADKNEAWVMEIIGKGAGSKGAVWVAVRIPDGYVSAHANQARISSFPLNDTENCIYSADVISFAKQKGYFKGKDKDFSFCDAYAPIDFGAMRGCEARVWSAFNIISDGMDQYIDYALGKSAQKRMPLYVKPNTKLSVKQVADIMRDHYEGTPLDMTTDIGAGGHGLPYRWRPMGFEVDGQKYINERAIATQQTGFWFLAEARNYLPDEIGGILWFGVDDAATSALTPIYSCSLDVPECFRKGNGSMSEYSPTSAFWIFNRVTNFAYLRYDLLSKEIIKVASEHENRCVERTKSIDAAALELYKESPQKAREFLTDYSIATATSLFNRWVELDRYLLVKYIDGNVKKENESGFEDNGNGRKIIAFPDQPGYNDKWKEAVARDAGDRLKSL